MSIQLIPTGRIAVLLALLLAACTAAPPEPALEDAATPQPTSDVIFAPPTAAAATAEATPVVLAPGEETVFVRIDKDDYEQIAPLEAVHVVDYNSFVWLELTPAGYDALLASGVRFRPYPNAARLNIRDYAFDTRYEEPVVPPGQEAILEPGVPAFYIVQFIGPNKDEWYDHLIDLGVVIIQAHPPLGYVVRMLPEQAPEVESLDFVRWVGPYHPAYKITRLLRRVLTEPEVAGVRVTDGMVENVVVWFYYKENAEPTIASTTEAVDALGGELLGVFPYVRAQVMLGSATFRLPVTSLVPVAQLSDVLLLDYSYPEPVLDVEG